MYLKRQYEAIKSQKGKTSNKIKQDKIITKNSIYYYSPYHNYKPIYAIFTSIASIYLYKKNVNPIHY